jgi:hypothetical protein
MSKRNFSEEESMMKEMAMEDMRLEAMEEARSQAMEEMRLQAMEEKMNEERMLMEEEKMMEENKMENRTNLTDENGSDVSINTNTNLLEDRNMETMEEMKMVNEKETKDMEVAKLTVDFANKLGVDVNTLDKGMIRYIHALLTCQKMDIKELYEDLKTAHEEREALSKLYSSELEIIDVFEKYKKHGIVESEIEKLGKKYLGKEEFNVDDLRNEIISNWSDFQEAKVATDEDELEFLEKLME